MGTFNGETIVDQTDHFLVTISSDTADTRGAAVAIASGCEGDLGILEGWFDYAWDDFPYGIWVSVGEDANNPRPHADTEWFGTSDSPHIRVYGATAANAAGLAFLGDELARMLFAAELAEVLMHASPNGWNPSNSAGEGLSRVAAAELHPLGYYRPAGSPGNGPYSTAWLQLAYRTRNMQDADTQGPPYDFVTVSEDTDGNILSFGCAIVFLYYLHSQLHYSWRQIATSWGAHLCETFAQLTGRASHSAFTEFSDVLNAHLPPGTTFAPATENVFPLSAAPPVVLVTSYGTSQGRTHRDWGRAALKAGPICEKEVYLYHQIDLTTPVSVVARAPGALAPHFSWELNGVALSSHSGPTQTTIPVRLVDTVPGMGEPAQENVPLLVTYVISDSSDRSQLTVTNLGFPGNVDALTFRAVMTEPGREVVPGQYTGSATASPRYRDYDMECRWYSDVERCNPQALGEAVIYRDALLGKLFALKNLPDPPPDQLADLADTAARYAAAAASLAATAPDVGRTLAILLPALSHALAAADTSAEITGRTTFRAAAPPPATLTDARSDGPN
jgi:hypothetical protein